MSLARIETYILGKLTNRGKPSFGVSFLKDYGDRDAIAAVLPQLCVIAHEVLAHAFTRDKTNDPVGTAKLTQVSTKIGVEIARLFYDDEIEWKDHVRIGDLFVEAFYQSKYIDIERKILGKKKVKNREGETVEVTDSVTTITVTQAWIDDFSEMPESLCKYRLRGTTFKLPQNIYGIMQKVEVGEELIARYPIVKGWGYPQHEQFSSMKEQACISGINKLQQTAWRINEPVLEALKVNKGTIVNTEKCDDKFEEERRLSKKIELDFTLAKADMLVGKRFYCLFDFDYRGRIYNRETIFNFQGSDTARGLFLFDEAKPVDDSGFDWLCIHAACSMNMSYKITDIPDWCVADYAKHLKEEGLEDISVDKMILQDRINWTLNHLDEIQMTAELNAISSAAEKPVSYLAVCHEINNYLKYQDAGLTYMSSLPVPIDGSNNGWQHLGAISKDTRTGELVGLVPVDIQNDFYVQTAKRLIEITTDERRAEILEDMPMKKIRKAISKRGSMTRAYSAGAKKIAENMINDLRKDDLDKKYEIDDKMCLGFSRDLIKAIEMTCTGPLLTMKYFQKIAMAIVEIENSVKWVTPSGFYVEYFNFHKKSVYQKGTISGYGTRGRVEHCAEITTDKVDQRGFACGISPNYVHSLDASHMAMVLTEWAGDFGAVHDSFSTHASEVADLLLLTKEVFVRMYDHENYFDNIERSFLNTTEFLVEQPLLGTLKIKEVMNSDYFFA